MVAFIKQEACEKINEIEARTEEDFNLKKGVFVQKERLKLMQYYDREEKNAVVRRKRYRSPFGHPPFHNELTSLTG